MGETYAGSTMEAVAAVPTANDLAGFQALTYEAGECTLQTFPQILRDWAAVEEPLVCKTTNSDVKGSAKWAPMDFTLSRVPTDALQIILRTLEASFNAVGSFKFTISGSGIVYLQAQVAKMPIADGGGQNTIHSSTGMLFIQDEPVLDGA